MTNNVNMTIMDRLEKKRSNMRDEEGKPYTIEKFAAYLNISVRTYKGYKQDGCKLSHDELYNISKKLGCSIDYLYGIDDQEEREVADVCKQTGLSTDAAKRLMSFNYVSKIHLFGEQDDLAYLVKGYIDLMSYIIENIGFAAIEKYLENVSTQSFIKIVEKMPESVQAELKDRYSLDFDLYETLKDYHKHLLIGAINNVLDEYEAQVPACIYLASKSATFGLKLNKYAKSKGERYDRAYNLAFGRTVIEAQGVGDKSKFVEYTRPTAEDWALFKEMTGLTKEDIPGYKEGESDEEK